VSAVTWDRLADQIADAASTDCLTPHDIRAMSDDEVREIFCTFRWPDTKGHPVCPNCGCVDVGVISTRQSFKCAACYDQFTPTTATIFARPKMPLRQYLLAVLVATDFRGENMATRLMLALGCEYKTAHNIWKKLQRNGCRLHVGPRLNPWSRA